jgi:formate dehydrogenase iron-sulfur subunit
MKIFVPGDSAAQSVGADLVAVAIAAEAAKRNLDIQIVRNGTRGALWLEPLVEVEKDGKRIGYTNVTSEDAAAVLDGSHASIGDVDSFEWLASQDRVTYKRVGIIDPLSIADYEAHGGFKGLARAQSMSQADIVAEVTESGLRGRGGAGFPAGIKWKTVMDAAADQKYICCNADEGDSGTFADRILMEGDPFTLIEGMAIAGLAVSATKGFIYVRSEYPAAISQLKKAIEIATPKLGNFELKVRSGAGSYVCGEETAMLESLEGKRGVVRAKPPLPALEGLFGKPTVINNVLTLASVPEIMASGAAAYKARGVGRSLGTQVFQLAGNIKQGGIVETGFGITLDKLINGYGAGTASGKPIRAIQVGGPLGAYFGQDKFNVSADYESMLEAGGMLGHGGIVLFDDSVNLAKQARFAMEFCSIESCGKCTPCRIGSTRGVETIDLIIAGKDVAKNKSLLLDLCEVMTDGSLCAMGGLTPLPVKSALQNFAEDFGSSGGGM